MSGNSFRSVFMVASCAAAALSCYLVSLRVASERAALEDVETEIVLAQRDIRLLQTEIGTRGRLAQLERWNVKVLALSAPSADQFLEGGFALAKMVAPRSKVDLDAPVVLAAAPVDAPRPQIEGIPQPGEQVEDGVSPKRMLVVASLKRDVATVDQSPTGQSAKATLSSAVSTKAPANMTSTPKATTPAKVKSAGAKPLASAKPKAAGATSHEKAAARDPLAPLGSPAAKTNKIVASTESSRRKDAGSKQ